MHNLKMSQVEKPFLFGVHRSSPVAPNRLRHRPVENTCRSRRPAIGLEGFVSTWTRYDEMMRWVGGSWSIWWCRKARLVVSGLVLLHTFSHQHGSHEAIFTARMTSTRFASSASCFIMSFDATRNLQAGCSCSFGTTSLAACWRAKARRTATGAPVPTGGPFKTDKLN